MYQLENSAGLDINVTLAWDAWIRVHAATDLVDVTAEIKELARPASANQELARGLLPV